jgi:putative ABC transport system substrate-binding protein
MVRERLAEFALQNRLLATHAFREFVVAGGLMSYGNSATDLFDTAAGYVERILKGERPKDLPMEQPTRFQFVVNAQTATTLGLILPQSILLFADEVIR